MCSNQYLYYRKQQPSLALMMLLYMLPDVRATPDINKVLYFTNVSFIIIIH